MKALSKGAGVGNGSNEVLDIIRESNARSLNELRKWDQANIGKNRPSHAPLINAHEQAFANDERLFDHQYRMMNRIESAVKKNGNGGGKASLTIFKGLMRVEGLEVRDIYRFLVIGAICFFLWMIYSDRITIHLHSGSDAVTEGLESEIHNH